MNGRRQPGYAVAACAVCCVLAIGGCAYFNSLYNARRAFEEGQSARLQDRSAQAASAYLEAIERAARSYRSDEEGRWADDALYIIGRSYYHGGDWARSRAALERLLQISGDSALRAGARVHLGGVALATGRRELGLQMLDDALDRVPDPALRAEAHIWRARASFDAGWVEEGWASLDRSEAASREMRVQVGLERLVRGIGHDHFGHALSGATAVLEAPSGEPWADTVFAAVERADILWGAERAATLLAAAERSEWSPRARGRARIRRAQALARAGDTVAATEAALDLARGNDRIAHEARVALARWRLSSVDRLEQLEEVRAILLPALALPEALRLIDFMEQVGLFAERAGTTNDHLALFAGAEVARDSLDSPTLARQLFTLYADRDRGAAWEGKALMAALELTGDPAEREALIARLDGMSANIYVQASKRTMTRPSDYALLEGRLGASLAILHQRIGAEALTREVAVRETARRLDSIRAAEEFARRIEAGDSLVLDSLRLDSLRLDSLRADSLRRNAPGANSTDRFFAPDTILQPDSVSQDTIPRDTIPRRDTIRASIRPSRTELSARETRGGAGAT